MNKRIYLKAHLTILILMLGVVGISSKTFADNQPPVADAGYDQTVAENALVTLDGGGSYDPDGDALYYCWTSNDIVLSEPNEMLTQFYAPVGVDQLEFTLTVRDRLNPGEGLSDSDTVMIYINERPVAIATADKDVVNIYDSLELDGRCSYDPDHFNYDPCNLGKLDDGISLYWWSIISGPDEIMSDPTAYLDPSYATSSHLAVFTPPQTINDSGPIYVTFRLTVTDQPQFSNDPVADQNDEVTVRINRYPSAQTNENQTVTEGDTVYLIGSDSYDIDNIEVDGNIPDDIIKDGIVDFADLDTLTDQWLLEKLPEDVAPHRGDGIVNFLDWAVFAEGWQNLKDFNDLTVFVDQWLQQGAHCADIGPKPNGDGIVNFLDFAVLAKGWLATYFDDINTYHWQQIPTSTVILNPIVSGEVSFEAPNVESLTFRLTVTDTEGLQDFEDVTIFIEPLPDILYVDKANQDGPWDGSLEYPYKTIQDALTEANGNLEIEIIEVRISNPDYDTYTEDLTLRASLTLKAQEQRDPVTQYRINMPIIQGRITMANNTCLEGFRLQKGSLGAPLVMADNTSGVKIAHNRLLLQDNATGTTINAIEIIDPQFEGDDIIYLHNNIIVVEATGAGCEGTGISLTQTDFNLETPEDKIKIKNNSIDIISDEHAYGLYIKANNYYVDATASTGIVVENNIIGVPRLSDGSRRDKNINYCINKDYSVPIKYLPVKYNDLFLRNANAGDDLVSIYVVTRPEFYNISTDPCYVDTEYHIHTQSSCIDAGNPTDDYSDEPEAGTPANMRINMGAHGNTVEATVKIE